VPFINRLELAAQRARRAVHQNGGERERFEAYAPMPLPRWRQAKAARARLGRTWSSFVTSSPGGAAMPTPVRSARSSAEGQYLWSSPTNWAKTLS
jgi:hypothetical protein